MNILYIVLCVFVCVFLFLEELCGGEHVPEKERERAKEKEESGQVLKYGCDYVHSTASIQKCFPVMTDQCSEHCWC